MSFLERIKSSFRLILDSLTFIGRNPRFLWYWLIAEVILLGCWYVFIYLRPFDFSLKGFDVLLAFLSTILLLISAICIYHMKNVILGLQTNSVGVIQELRFLALPLLILSVIRIAIKVCEDLFMQAYVSLDQLTTYFMIRKFPLVNVLFWVPRSLIFLLIAIMVFEHVRILKACSIAWSVLKRAWPQLLVWVLVMMVLDLVLYACVGSLAVFAMQSTPLASVLVLSRVILIARSFVRFILGLTFMVQLYNAYRRGQV